jgi:hypothetical protein
VFVPNGLGVREILLTLFLAPEVAEQFGMATAEASKLAKVGVVILRLVWTTAEVAIWAIVCWGPRPVIPDSEESKT